MLPELVNIATSVVAFALFIYLYKNPKHIYYSFIFVSIGLSSLILNGSYPAVDEILLFSLSISGLLRIRWKELFKSNFSDFPKILSFILISYLLLNTVLSALDYFEISNLRFIALYLNIILIILSMISIPQETTKIKEISKLAIKINLYCWVTYWFILKSVGISWESQQGVSWAGTAYAAIIPTFGVFALLIYQKEKERKFFSKSYIFYFFVTVMASQLYDSRVLTFSIVLGMVVISIYTRSFRKTFVIYIIFITAIVSANALNDGSITSKDLFKLFTGYPINYAKGATPSANFILDPRESDIGRSQEIRCATSTVFLESDPLRFTIGYGQNSHKYILEKCFDRSSSVSKGSGSVRPVGFAAFLVDFGFLGLSLFLILIFIIFRRLLQFRNAYVLIFASTLVFAHLLVTNALDSTFLYLLLCSNFLLKSLEIQSNQTMNP